AAQVELAAVIEAVVGGRDFRGRPLRGGIDRRQVRVQGEADPAVAARGQRRHVAAQRLVGIDRRREADGLRRRVSGRRLRGGAARGGGRARRRGGPCRRRRRVPLGPLPVDAPPARVFRRDRRGAGERVAPADVQAVDGPPLDAAAGGPVRQGQQVAVLLAG